ncbi:hypothetical protein RB195_000234 [Necator americanus]|uniref:Uncharacterized protein n=1 Tax=Necator americanus TaxID=51031 RepID=A0ABR1D8P2_NECAM
MTTSPARKKAPSASFCLTPVTTSDVVVRPAGVQSANRCSLIHVIESENEISWYIDGAKQGAMKREDSREVAGKVGGRAIFMIAAVVGLDEVTKRKKPMI